MNDGVGVDPGVNVINDGAGVESQNDSGGVEPTLDSANDGARVLGGSNGGAITDAIYDGVGVDEP